MKAIKANDKSVRDHSQEASIYGEKITVTSRVGRTATSRFWFTIDQWADLNRTISPCFEKRRFILEHTGQLDNEAGGPDQADRIRDSMIAAVDKAFRLAGLSAADPRGL